MEIEHLECFVMTWRMSYINPHTHTRDTLDGASTLLMWTLWVQWRPTNAKMHPRKYQPLLTGKAFIREPWVRVLTLKASLSFGPSLCASLTRFFKIVNYGVVVDLAFFFQIQECLSPVQKSGPISCSHYNNSPTLGWRLYICTEFYYKLEFGIV